MTAAAIACALPRLQPEDPGARLLLFGIRQTGASGLADAATAHAFMTAFGKSFRRPLLLMRTMMAEMSMAASGPIQIAPWCCPRMTPAEAAILEILANPANPARGRVLLADLLGKRDVDGVLTTSLALATAFADAGLPLRLDES